MIYDWTIVEEPDAGDTGTRMERVRTQGGWLVRATLIESTWNRGLQTYEQRPLSVSICFVPEPTP